MTLNMEGFGDHKIYSYHILEEFDTVQRMLVACQNNINKLISWRNDDKNDTWKWLSPFLIYHEYSIRAFDGHNLSFLTFAYKRRAVIALMSSNQFLEMTLGDHICSEYCDKVTSKLSNRISSGFTIDTPYLSLNDRQISHEGRHRAMAAISCGQ